MKNRSKYKIDESLKYMVFNNTINWEIYIHIIIVNISINRSPIKNFNNLPPRKFEISKISADGKFLKILFKNNININPNIPLNIQLIKAPVPFWFIKILGVFNIIEFIENIIIIQNASILDNFLFINYFFLFNIFSISYLYGFLNVVF